MRMHTGLPLWLYTLLSNGFLGRFRKKAKCLRVPVKVPKLTALHIFQSNWTEEWECVFRWEPHSMRQNDVREKISDKWRKEDSRRRRDRVVWRPPKTHHGLLMQSTHYVMNTYSVISAHFFRDLSSLGPHASSPSSPDERTTARLDVLCTIIHPS